ncbi:flavodoxin-dependent (E)-4-hydroxy-3-methylbut-2-enyl-diphosphate synthase [Candidatus Omnitrophota bacterium]
MRIKRRQSRVVRIGGVRIGGSQPVAIQSMIKTRTAHIEESVRQIKELEHLGCQIIRVAVRDSVDARAIKEIKRRIRIPLVADIHFNWRLGVEAIGCGADKIRLNPGNIYKPDEVRQIAACARSAKIPIRVGVNSGSVRLKNGSKLSMPEKLAKSALNYARLLERSGFGDIVLSLKASNVRDTVEAYRKAAKLCDYPLHLGVTASGLPAKGLTKSAIALGVLLLEGIGDTIRISLTQQPQEEIRAAKSILESLELRKFGPQIISCPTCGRCEVDLVGIVRGLEKSLSRIRFNPKARFPEVAVMGCAVNGPGEAREADIGLAFGKTSGLFFKKGQVVKSVPYNKCAALILKEIQKSSKSIKE